VSPEVQDFLERAAESMAEASDLERHGVRPEVPGSTPPTGSNSISFLSPRRQDAKVGTALPAGAEGRLLSVRVVRFSSPHRFCLFPAFLCAFASLRDHHLSLFEPVRKRMCCLCFAALALGPVSVAAGESAAALPPEAKTTVERFQAGPSVFIENRGQWDHDSILFALDSQGANVGLTAEGPRFQLFRREPRIGPAPAPEPPKHGRRPGETASSEPARAPVPLPLLPR